MSRGYESQAVTVGTLARILSANYGVSERMAYSLLREGLNLITSALVDGQRVHLTSLGTFHLSNRKAIKGCPPKGAPYDIPDHARPTFRPAKWLRQLPAVEPCVMDGCPF